MERIIYIVFMNVMVVVSKTGMADTIDTTGQAPYEQCGYCHEYDGNSLVSTTPKLASQVPGYIKKQLEDFRAGKRQGKMQATAELLSDEDIATVSRYFNEQQVSKTGSDTLSRQDRIVATGLFFSGDKRRAIRACSSCHGQNAEGLGIFPRLAGQHKDYLVEQLVAFKSGTRVNDKLGMMRMPSKQLSDHEIASLAGYLAGLPGIHQPGNQ